MSEIERPTSSQDRAEDSRTHNSRESDGQALRRSEDPVDMASKDTFTDKSEPSPPTKTSTQDEQWVEEHNGVSEPSAKDGTTEAPPLPEEAIPPLPAEALPTTEEADDGWAPVWEESAQAFYFYNRFTGATQWTNPRVPKASQPPPPGIESEEPPAPRPAGGYDPAIHGDYDPTAWYAQPSTSTEDPTTTATSTDPAEAYAATGEFNRFTGKWQAADLNPERFNDENKSKRQMNAFFDVDAAANSHDGRSLKAERSGKKLSKSELKQFKEKRKAKKEEKRRAWLRD